MICLVAIAVLVTLSDLRTRTIPNKLSGALALLALAFQLVRLLAPDALGALPAEAALARGSDAPGACLAWGVATCLALVAAEAVARRVTGRAGLGMGDVKFFSAWALLLGSATPVAIALSCGLGAVWATARGESSFPLGPWASLACLGVAAALALGAGHATAMVGW